MRIRFVGQLVVEYFAAPSHTTKTDSGKREFDYFLTLNIPLNSGFLLLGSPGTRIIVLKRGRVRNENEYELLAQNGKQGMALGTLMSHFSALWASKRWLMKMVCKRD